MTTEASRNENHSVIRVVDFIAHYSDAVALALHGEEGELFTIRNRGAVLVLLGAAGVISSLSYAKIQRDLQREAADEFADTLPEELAA